MYFQFFIKKILTNFLAAFLVCLSVADGQEAEHEFPHDDFEVAEIQYDYVDFPQSRVRNNTLSYSSIQRIAAYNTFSFEFSNIVPNLFSNSKLNKINQLHTHPLITHLVKVVVCKNAP
jgi:hypothetical protein